jgi:iron-sulfur cluster repair protein YtfE (RIC family)
MRHPSLVLLSHDHHHGLALALRCRKQALGQLKPPGTTGLRERAKEFLDFFAANLVPHFRAEEEILFPLLRSKVVESETIIQQLLHDHEQIRQAMSQLEAGTALGKVIFDLGDLLERHIRKEERELFPLFEYHAEEMDTETVGAKISKIIQHGAAL